MDRKGTKFGHKKENDMLDKYKQTFTEERWNELCDLVKRKGMKIRAQDFTASEIRAIIEETPLTENQRQGAIMYYVNKNKQIDISIRLNYSESTIKYYKKRVSKALRTTCCRMFK